MKLHKRLWEMVTAKPPQAISMKNGPYRVIVVPFGKYAGTWSFSTERRRLSYSFDSMKPWVWTRTPNVAYPDERLPAPEAFHIVLPKSLLGGVEYGSVMRYELTRKAACLATWAWKQTGAAEVLTLLELLPKMEATELVARLCLPELLRAWAENPVRTEAILTKLNFHFSFVQSLGARKRQVFVRRALRVGVKKSFRACFPKCPNRLLNSAVECLGVDPKTLTQARPGIDDVPYPVWGAWLRYEKVGHLFVLHRVGDPDPAKISKERYLNYGRRFGFTALGPLEAYANELPGNPHGWGPSDLIEPVEVERRHTVLAQETQRHWADIMARQAPFRTPQVDFTERHAKNWEGLPRPDSFRPLLSREDFANEGAEMHHCVGMYYGDTGSLFAAIRSGDEKATIQFRIADQQLIQVFGVCNQHVSEAMRTLVADWIWALTQEWAARSVASCQQQQLNS